MNLTNENFNFGPSETTLQAAYQATNYSKMIMANCQLNDMTNLDEHCFMLTVDVREGKLDSVKNQYVIRSGSYFLVDHTQAHLI